MGQYEDAAAKFFRDAFPAKVVSGDIRSLAALLEQYALKVPRAAKDTASSWREMDGSVPALLERVYEPILGPHEHLSCIGSITNYRAGTCWMLIVNGRIIRQSELIEGPEPIGDAKRACDDFRDRVVAMWNA